MMNCREAVEKLYGYLDRQLTEEETIEVQRHLDRCPSCADYFRFEKGVLTRIHQVCREVEVPSTLVDRVRKICEEGNRRP